MKTQQRITMHTAAALGAVCLSFSVLAADALQLVTDADMARESHLAATTKPVYEPKAFVPGAPLIDVSSPKTEGTLKAPFPIHVAFKPQEGAEVVPGSFQALYGAFKFDITERITKKAKVTKEGIDVSEANIPAGSHKLTVRITDSQGRVGEKQVAFTVE